ncbi:hypothetical protein RUND412_007849 [Rhizina undulata]
MSEQTPSACTICNKPTTNLCAKCKSVAYCSRECQKPDWNVHKALCSEVATLSSINHPYGPEALVHAAIFFPEDGQKPRFVKVAEINGQLLTALYLGIRMEKTVPISTNLIRERAFDGYELLFHHLNDYHLNEVNVNASIKKVTGSYYTYTWKGPVIVCKQKITPTTKQFCDIGMEDFRDVVDYFQMYRCTDTLGYLRKWTNNPASAPAGERVQGVAVVCKGDRELSGYEEFIEVPVPEFHSIFDCDPTPISPLLELPIFTYKLHIEHWKFKDPIWADNNSFGNLPGTFLNIAPDNGIADVFKWQDGIGNILVVRKDRKPLTIEHLEVLYKFHRFHLINLFDSDGSEQEIKEAMTKEGFLRYFDEYRKTMTGENKTAEERERWKNVFSPYEI